MCEKTSAKKPRLEIRGYRGKKRRCLGLDRHPCFPTMIFCTLVRKKFRVSWVGRRSRLRLIVFLTCEGQDFFFFFFFLYRRLMSVRWCLRLILFLEAFCHSKDGGSFRFHRETTKASLVVASLSVSFHISDRSRGLFLHRDTLRVATVLASTRPVEISKLPGAASCRVVYFAN